MSVPIVAINAANPVDQPPYPSEIPFGKWRLSALRRTLELESEAVRQLD